MKHLYKLIFTCGIVISGLSAKAQCTSNTSNTPGVYPSTLDSACILQNYSDTTTIVFVRDTVVFGFTLVVDSVVITSVTNIPAGLSYQCGNNPCTAYGGGTQNPRICFLFNGTPTAAVTNDSIMVSYLIYVTVPFVGVQSLPRTAQVYITVNEADTSVTQTGNTLQSNQAGGSYVWIDCNTNIPVPGEISQIFTPSANGDYAVIVTHKTCSDTSACYSITSVGMQDINGNQNTVAIYPNPCNGNLTIKVTGSLVETQYLKIVTVLGQEIYGSSKVLNNSTVDMSGEAKGIYFVHLKTANGIITSKMLIK